MKHMMVWLMEVHMAACHFLVLKKNQLVYMIVCYSKWKDERTKQYICQAVVFSELIHIVDLWKNHFFSNSFFWILRTSICPKGCNCIHRFLAF